MKAMFYRLCSLLSCALVFIAAFNIKPASMGWAYQPRVPKCLTK